MAKQGRNTKETYLLEALRLFAERGYEAVGVVDIAQAVGCTTSALYKHFAGKKALFDAIVERSKEGFRENMNRLQVDFSEQSQEKKRVLAMTEADQIALIHGLFHGVVESEYPRLFRKLMTVEQFKHPELAEIYNQYYVKAQIHAFQSLMEAWVKEGIVRPCDPKMMAVQYVSPIIVAVSVCDREPERSGEMLALLEDHVRHFNEVYRLKEGG